MRAKPSHGHGVVRTGFGFVIEVGVWWKEDVESYKVQMALKILLIPPHQIDVCR